MSDISFVCADKENNGRISNAVFTLAPELGTSKTDKPLDLFVNKKLDFNRLSNPKFTLINKSDRNLDQPNYHPLT